MGARSATPILYAVDATASAEWYGKLGFEIDFIHRFDDHSPLFVGIKSETAGLMLSEHRGDARPHGLVYVTVDDLDEAASAVGVPVELQEWGIREAHAVDPSGNRVRVAQHQEEQASG